MIYTLIEEFELKVELVFLIRDDFIHFAIVAYVRVFNFLLLNINHVLSFLSIIQVHQMQS